MNTSIVLVLAVVCFFIGVIAAYLVQSLREESKPVQEAPNMQDEEEPGEERFAAASSFSQAPAAAEEQEPDSSLTPAPPPGMVEVARFWRDEDSRKPALEMDGVLFHTSDQMSPVQLDKLEAAIKELSAWSGKPLHSERPTIETGAFLTGEIVEGPSFKPPRIGPLDILKNTLDADVRSALKAAPKSLAAQVDEILQAKLVDSSLADRGIRIMDTPSSDLVVMVGLDKYDGVEAIPDAEIQAMIREAVAEWGRRATLED